MTHNLQQNGWCILQLENTNALDRATRSLEQKLNDLVGVSELASYHQHVSEKSHSLLHEELCAFTRNQKFGKQIISDNVDLFKPLVGEDILIQRNPYLRIARPHEQKDNIGYHRDTYYGASPYEISIVIPFLDLTSNESLSVLSGSHIKPEDYYSYTQTISEDVQKGSKRHSLGFLYAPKVMDPIVEKEMQGVSLKYGEVLVFLLTTVHGSVVNSGNNSRWTMDVRLMNPYVPVDLSARPDYYEDLTFCPVTACAEKYLSNSGELVTRN